MGLKRWAGWDSVSLGVGCNFGALFRFMARGIELSLRGAPLLSFSLAKLLISWSCCSPHSEIPSTF